jgi:hypothetical protein
MAEPSVRPSDPDWADQATDAVIKVVDSVREKTTGPVLNVARGIVYGLIGFFAALVAVIVLTIALIRMLDVYLPGEVWSAYLLLGLVFSVAGLVLWRRRYAPEAA